MTTRSLAWRQRPLGRVADLQQEAGAMSLMWGLALVLVAVLLGVRNLPGFGPGVCYLLVLHSLRGPRQTVEALGVLAYMLLLGGVGISTERWLVIFAAFSRTAWDSIVSGLPTPRFVRPLAIFTLTIVVITPFASVFPIVSLFKVLSFAAGVGTLFTALYRTPTLSTYWTRWFFTMGAVILLASAGVYLAGGGYLTNSVGFQGILSHPQTYGPVLAPLAALMTGLYLLEGKRTVLIGACSALAWIGMYMSQARTSLLATILGLGLAVAVAFMFRPDWRAAVGRLFSRWEAVAFAMALVLFVAVQWSSFQEKAFGFLLKDDGSESVAGVLRGSRGELMDRSMANFHESPLLGIGFGVPSDASRFDTKLVTGFMGLPTRASVEKGFMPTALLEETGVVGAFFTILLLLALFVPIVRTAGFTVFWIATACVLVNFGEMVFFSLGGMGLYFWLVLALCSFFATTSSTIEARGGEDQGAG